MPEKGLIDLVMYGPPDDHYSAALTETNKGLHLLKKYKKCVKLTGNKQECDKKLMNTKSKNDSH